MATRSGYAEAIAILSKRTHDPEDGNPTWPTLRAGPDTYSGWKLYIYAAAPGDVKEALRLIWPVAEERDLTVQGARSEAFTFPEEHPQAHKGVIITLPRRATKTQDVAAICAALVSYTYPTHGDAKPVKGANPIAGAVSVRLEHSRDLGRDATPEEHVELYTPSKPFMDLLEAEYQKILKAIHDDIQRQTLN
jgi:hypothetical protein